jgi:hypothetical protein
MDRSEQPDDLRLDVIGVLVFVDQDVAELRRVTLADSEVGLEEIEGEREQVVEIDGVRRFFLVPA